MRPIKFRYTVKRRNKHIFSEIFTIKQIELGEFMQWASVNHVGATDELIKDQFTELTDKNNVEIYAGDIANSIYGVGRVYWDHNKKQFCFEFDLDSDVLWLMTSGKEGKTFEILGNIYQNSDLLK